MKPVVYIDGKEGTTGLQIFERLGSRDDIDLILIDEDKRKDTAERKKFINAADNEENYLYVDLDRKPELRNEWFKSLSDDGIEMSQNKVEHVSFWIQEMEAWFLKQPEAIELWAEDENFIRKPGQNSPLSEHPSIKNKDIERLQQKASY